MMESAVGEESRFVDPLHVVRMIGVHAGSRVADVGTGSGAYALALARVVGEEGRVYAIDVQKDMLTRLANEASKRGYKNLEMIWGDVDRTGGSKIADHSLDIVLFSNVLFQLEAKDIALQEMHRILKPEGVLAIIEWSDSFNGMGPHPDEVVTAAQAKHLADAAGFSLRQDFAAGTHHYGILFNSH
jgi:ubiquinone/menaquinone biosynthesis C-methylase UbiE